VRVTCYYLSNDNESYTELGLEYPTLNHKMQIEKTFPNTPKTSILEQEKVEQV